MQEALRAAGVECWRNHYLDLQLPPNMDAATVERKCKSYCRFKLALEQPGARVIATVVRDAIDRRLSGVWYSRHQEMLQDFNGETFGPEAEEHFVRKYRTLAWLDRDYPRRVYRPLGLTQPPRPGSHCGPNNISVEVLRFERLEEDFATFATNYLQRNLRLDRVHTGTGIGGQEYGIFRAWALREFAGTGFLELD